MPRDPDRTRAAAPAARPAGRPMRRFVLLFAVIATALFALYQVSETTRSFRHVNIWNAAASSALLRAANVDAQREGTMVQMPQGGMEIISECSAVYVLILFAAGVLAFPAPWSARWRGLALGVPAILAVNVLRLVTLGLVIEYRSDWLRFFHEYLWQVFFVLLVAALYLLWIERFVTRARPDPSA